MKAAVMTAGDAPAFAEFEEPAASSNLIVVDVLASALSRLDMVVAQRRHYIKPPDGPFVVGREGVGRRSDGQRIYFNAFAAQAPYGSMAERTLIDPALSFPVPEGIDDARAAALGNSGLAAWLPLSWRARLQPGETVLVLGATGAAGLLAVAAARLLGAGRVIAAGRNPLALQRAMRLGADAVVDLATADVTTADLMRAFRDTAGTDIDVVIDYICGVPAEAALAALGTNGRLVHIGQMAAPAMTANGGILRRGNIDVLGFAYYHAPIALQAEAFVKLCQHTAAGEMETDIEELPLADIASAWAAQSNETRRRFVLRP
jgi:NADPH2:quinone reductase